MLKRIYAVPLLCIASLLLFLPTSVSVPHIEPIPHSEPSEVFMRDLLAPYQALTVEMRSGAMFNSPRVIIPKEPIPTVKVTKESHRTYLDEFTITAYCACSKCCGKWSGMEMSIPREDGTPYPQEGYTVAVDPKIISLRSTIEIDELGTRYAHDTGVKGNHIDVFFESHEDALVFGRQTLGVWLICEEGG